MGTPNFQTRITTRVKGVAPKLRYIAFYHRDEDRLNACMHGYEGRSFVYILTGNYNGQEHFLYVGMTKAQYARSLMHAKKFAYDNIYLFECEPEHLLACERAVIAELCPLYNRSLNPRADKYRRFLGIDYEAVQDADTIRKHLALLTEYEKKGLFGFSLSAQVFSALEEEAAEQGASCSEYLQGILERELGERVAEKLRDEFCGFGGNQSDNCKGVWKAVQKESGTDQGISFAAWPDPGYCQDRQRLGDPPGR